MEAKKNPKELNHFVEQIRLMHSSDSAYQHLLDTIADDVKDAFADEKEKDTVCLDDVIDYIRRWRP